MVQGIPSESDHTRVFPGPRVSCWPTVPGAVGQTYELNAEGLFRRRKLFVNIAEEESTERTPVLEMITPVPAVTPCGVPGRTNP